MYRGVACLGLRGNSTNHGLECTWCIVPSIIHLTDESIIGSSCVSLTGLMQVCLLSAYYKLLARSLKEVLIFTLSDNSVRVI